MSFNGSGTFNINTAGQPVVTGTVISSSVFNALTADLATGLSTCITKDGQTTVTANIPMNSFKFTGLAAGTAATDSVRLGQLQAGAATLITVTGTNTYAGTMTPALSAYAAGNTFTFLVPNTNTTSCTLNIDGLGAKSITRDGTTALVAGDLVANSEVVVVYDGTQFQVLNSNSKTNFNLSGTLTVAGNTTLSGGTANQVQYLNASKVLSGSANLTFDGTTLTAAGLSGPHNGTVGATTPNTGAFTTLTTSSTVTINGGTANGVAYLNGSKVLTTGSALQFSGTYLQTLNGTGIQMQNAGATANWFFETSGLNLSFTSAQNGAAIWSINGSEQMRLNSTGLGIGTSSPTSKLSISGGLDFKSYIAHADNFALYANSTDGTTLSAYTGYPITFRIANSEQMRLTSTGLGIGTSSPSQKLNVATASGNAYMRVERASQATGQVGLQIGGGTSGTDWLLYQPTSSNDFRLFGNSADRVVVTSAGNVTINAPSSGTALTVNGAVSATGDAASVSYYVAAAGAIRWNGSSDAYLDYANSPGKLNIRSAAGTNTVAVFDASGNLGLGVTPSAWSQGKAFELRDVGFGIWNGTQSIYSIANAYFNGGFKYANTGVQASHYYQYQGQHVWSTAPSGTAGNAISFTQAMTLDSSGNLLVGTTSASFNSSNSTFFYPTTGYWVVNHANGTSTGTRYIGFGYNTGEIGSITQSGTTGVLYNITSDYRLKEFVAPVTNAGERIDALNPVEFDWKSDGSRARGFFAHEFQQVYANSVTGEKDGVDADGNPVYQTMQASTAEVIADLVAEIKSLRQRVAQLEEK